MKNMKKLFAMVLALALCFSLAIPAMAAGTHTLTVKTPMSGHTYGAYQIFKGALSTDGKVLSSVEWGSGVDTAKLVDGKTLLQALQEMSLKTYVLGVEQAPSTIFATATTAADIAEAIAGAGWQNGDAELEKVATVIGKYLSDTAATSTQKKNDLGEFIKDGDNYVYEIPGLEDGYYLVKTTEVPAGDNQYFTDYILHIVKSVTVTTKGSYPEVDKSVYNGEHSEFKDYGDGYIGQTVIYKLRGTLPATFGEYDTYWFEFEDTVSAGLTLEEADVTKVYVSRESDGTSPRIELDLTHLEGNKDDLVDGKFTSDKMWYWEKSGQNMTIRFPELIGRTFVAKDGEGDDVTITIRSSDIFFAEYTAKIDKDAVIGGAGNTNSVKLEYNNDPNNRGNGGTTPPAKTTVYSYALELVKFNADDATQVLPGAEFQISLVISGVEHYAKFDANRKFDGWTTNKDETSTILVTDANGKIKVEGLDEGKYILTETKAPDGYNKLHTSIEVTIDATINEATQALTSLAVTVNGGDSTGTGNVANGTVTVNVPNGQGATLPSTGGVGTTMFYVTGAILVAAAIVLLVTKKRMGEEN